MNSKIKLRPPPGSFVNLTAEQWIYVQKKIALAGEMKSTIKHFLEGDASRVQLRNAMENYLNVPEEMFEEREY